MNDDGWQDINMRPVFIVYVLGVNIKCYKILKNAKCAKRDFGEQFALGKY
jgi:hypothetical protein